MNSRWINSFYTYFKACNDNDIKTIRCLEKQIGTEI